jgi:ketosteroid isomerase-like protein
VTSLVVGATLDDSFTHVQRREERRSMGVESQSSLQKVLDQLQRAMNEHDLEALLACIHPDYQSEQPAHPERGFGGRDQVEKNWSALFDGIRDFHAELLDTAVQDDTAWTEWKWTGTRADGSALDIRGVTLFCIERGLITSGRLYMEEVEEEGENIDEAVRRVSGREQEG